MQKLLIRLWVSLTKKMLLTQPPYSSLNNTSGFALPMALALGLSMITLGFITVILAQDARDTAVLRQEVVASNLTSDSAIAEILTQISEPNNSFLLGKNYDPINPKTGATYLGADGILNSGDEGSKSINEWDSLTPICTAESPNISMTNSIGHQANYKLIAYRYSSVSQSGHLLVEGTYEGITSYVYVNLAINPDLSKFPGVVATGATYWQGRNLNGAFYFNPIASANTTLFETAERNDMNRSAYLNAVRSGSADGYVTDEIKGGLVACEVKFTLPYTAKGTKLGLLNNSRALKGLSSGITDYQIEQIDLSGTQELTIDTTAGPVHLYVTGSTTLRDNAKITNIRTDGFPPRVGDLRLIHTVADGSAAAVLYDRACISNAFLYAPKVSVHLLTNGSGCLDAVNSIQGVVWTEDIENSTNSLTASSYDRGGAPDLLTSGVTSGISVPKYNLELTDVVDSINYSPNYNIGEIRAWKKVDL